jgi:hypothetical protein
MSPSRSSAMPEFKLTQTVHPEDSPQRAAKVTPRASTTVTQAGGPRCMAAGVHLLSYRQNLPGWTRSFINKLLLLERFNCRFGRHETYKKKYSAIWERVSSQVVGMVSCDFSPNIARLRLMTADFGLNAFSIWFALLTILSETVSAVIQYLANTGSKEAMDAVLRVVGTTDNLQKIGEALGSGVSGAGIASKSKYAMTFGVAVAAIAVQALLVLIFLYFVAMLVVVYISPTSLQKAVTHTLKDWYDQECYWNSPFLHSSLSKAKAIQLIASVLSFIIVVFGLSIVPESGVAFGAVAFPALTTIKTIMSSMPKSTAIVTSACPNQEYISLQSEVLSFSLKDLPEIGLMEMLFTPTSQLLAQAEAVALAHVLLKTKSSLPAITIKPDIVISTDSTTPSAQP